MPVGTTLVLDERLMPQEPASGNNRGGSALHQMGQVNPQQPTGHRRAGDIAVGQRVERIPTVVPGHARLSEHAPASLPFFRNSRRKERQQRVERVLNQVAAGGRESREPVFKRHPLQRIPQCIDPGDDFTPMRGLGIDEVVDPPEGVRYPRQVDDRHGSRNPPASCPETCPCPARGRVGCSV